eukprot:Phypoly_transcript_01935.p1 GENE.Phypoly_transcript_01935~~Phypoly_transcript_01935.p1  ORF type:complete len:958 (+),score=129.30 Phypoly_transcript_01935:139-3012(+)
MEGYLKKRGKGAIASLKRRWCVLRENFLYYYKNKEDTNHSGCIDLCACDAANSAHLPFGFDLFVPGRTYQFQAATNEERDQWIQDIKSRRKVDAANSSTLIFSATEIYTVKCQAQGLVVKDHNLVHHADSYFAIYTNLHPDATGTRVLVYKSEVIPQNNNPAWQPFDLDPELVGGLDSNFEFACFDLATNGQSTPIGSISTTLRTFVNPGAHFALFGTGKGDICVTSASSKPKTEANRPVRGLTITAKGINLEAKELNGTSDAYLVFRALPKVLNTSNPGRPTTIQRTEVAMKTCNPTWQSFDLEADFCGGLDGNVIVECWNYDNSSKHELIGTCNFTIREVLASCSAQFYIVNITRSRPGYRNSGILALHVESKRYTPAPTLPPATTFAIKMCGKSLDSIDTFGKSDPFFVVKGSPFVYESHPFHSTGGRLSSCVIYKSEVTPKTSNPNWCLFKLSINLCGGLDNPLTIEVYNMDEGVPGLIGSANTTLRELTCKQPMLMLTNPHKTMGSYAGQLIVQDSTKLPDDDDTPPHPISYTIKCSAIDVERAAGLLGLSKSAPMLIIKATPYDNTRVTIYKSEIVPHSTKPSWKPFTIELAQAGGMDSQIIIECHSCENPAKNEFLGSCTLTLREISLWKNQSIYAFVNPSKTRPGYKNSGLLKFEEVTENFAGQEQPPNINIASLSIASSPPRTNGSSHSQDPYASPPPTYVPPQQAYTSYPQSTGYPQQNPGYPPNYNYPPQNSGYPQNYNYPPQNSGYPPQISIQPPASYQQQPTYIPQNYVYPSQTSSPYPSAAASPYPTSQSAAFLHPHQAQHEVFIQTGTSPTNQTGFPSAASSALPRPQSSYPQPSLTPYDLAPNSYEDPSLRSAGSLRTSGTGQYPTSSLRTSGTGQYPSPNGSQPSSPNKDNNTLAPPTSTPLRTSNSGQSPKKTEGASGGLALANSVATAIGTPFLYGIR